MAQAWLVAHELDCVGIALEPLVLGDHACGVTLAEAIPQGHKFALRRLVSGEAVIKLGQAIGRASCDIASGTHVHSHNLACDAAVDRDTVDTNLHQPAPRTASFQGFVRPDGRVGTRNFIAVLTTVNCSATVAKRIAGHFTPEHLAKFPNVDGVFAVAHGSGCGMAKSGRGIDNLRRTLAGYADHPNVAAALVIGLGCEVNQTDALMAETGMQESERLHLLSIQDQGGTLATIAAGIAEVEAMLPAANACLRETVSATHLTIGLQCGGSDGYSAITANPALGVASDMVVAAGGRVILSETPEVYGAENLLLRRAASPSVASALIERLDWWEHYAEQDGETLNNNPSPGNKAGGITTIQEKALGAVTKAGSSPLNAVIAYAERVSAPGLSFMDSPGYDPCSATGQIASGANLIAFTTGRGSVFGSIPAPTIKLATNSVLARHMADDIDVDCSPVLSGTSMAEMGAQIFEAMLAFASGEPTSSEVLGMGESEFVPWVPGAIY